MTGHIQITVPFLELIGSSSTWGKAGTPRILLRLMVLEFRDFPHTSKQKERGSVCLHITPGWLESLCSSPGSCNLASQHTRWVRFPRREYGTGGRDSQRSNSGASTFKGSAKKEITVKTCVRGQRVWRGTSRKLLQ